MREINLEEFLKVGIATSVVVYGFDGKELKILLVKNERDPFKGAYILPSEYVMPNEPVEVIARKIIKNSLGFDDVYLEQLNAFTKVFRNPLGRVINIAFYVLIPYHHIKEVKEVIDTDNGIYWVNMDEIPDLAFDHNEIISLSHERLKRRIKTRPLGFNLLPEEFTIGQLQRIYETVLGKKMDKRNFRKKIFKSELLMDTGKKTNPDKKNKIAKLYRFDMTNYEKMNLKGYDFKF